MSGTECSPQSSAQRSCTVAQPSPMCTAHAAQCHAHPTCVPQHVHICCTVIHLTLILISPLMDPPTPVSSSLAILRHLCRFMDTRDVLVVQPTADGTGVDLVEEVSNKRLDTWFETHGNHHVGDRLLQHSTCIYTSFLFSVSHLGILSHGFSALHCMRQKMGVMRPNVSRSSQTYLCCPPHLYFYRLICQGDL